MPSPDAPARAPHRVKRATYRIEYSPELLAELRQRYEETPESLETIAGRRGFSRGTLQVVARRGGWVRFQRPALDLSPAVKLDARLAAAEKQSAAPPAESNSAPAPDDSGVHATLRRVAAAGLAEAEAQVHALSAARAQMEETGRYGQAASLGRDLAAITSSLYRIKRIYGGDPANEPQDSHATPLSLDARRDALARRIDAILVQWLDEAARRHLA